MTDKNTIKAARLAALYELRDMLPGVSQQQLADLFKLGHRSTAGRDLAGLAELAGHASVDTTARYDRRPEAAKAKAAGKLHLPYKGRMV